MNTTAERQEELVSLVYVSSSVRAMASQEIVEILRTARRKNEQLGVTGMLLYKDGNFMQALEGHDSTMRDLMASIERDKRHHGLIQLVRKPIQERQFARWSMAFTDLDGMSEEDKKAYSPFLKGSLLDQEFRSKPDLSYRLLLHFKQNLR